MTDGMGGDDWETMLDSGIFLKILTINEFKTAEQYNVASYSFLTSNPLSQHR